MAQKTIDQPQNPQSSKPSLWIKLTVASLILVSALLISAWDLGWWQGWAYSMMMFAITVGGRIWADVRNPGLLAERAKAEKAENVKPWDKALSPLMALTGTLALYMVAGLDHRFGWSPAFPTWLTIVGLLLVFLGYAFSTWAMLENRFFSGLVRIQWDCGHVVCDVGTYRVVRHPGYAGNLPALPGIVLGLASLWAIIPAALALVVTVIRTLLEDQTLQEELPGYKEYAQRTCFRLIPGIY